MPRKPQRPKPRLTGPRKLTKGKARPKRNKAPEKQYGAVFVRYADQNLHTYDIRAGQLVPDGKSIMQYIADGCHVQDTGKAPQGYTRHEIRPEIKTKW
jgi:hypothetical protein